MLVNGQSDASRKEAYLLNLFKNPAHQLQAIEDLYLMVKAQPCYKNMKEPNWKATDTPLTIIAYYLRKLGRLTKGAEWTLDTIPSKPGQPIKFRFVAYKNYHSQLVTDRVFNTSLEFLPKVEKSDPHLHQLLLLTFAYISKNCNIPFWDTDGDYSAQIATLPKLNQLEPGTDEYLRTSIYLSYPAAHYLTLLKKLRRQVTAKMVATQLATWHAKPTERKRRICDWVRNALQLKGNLAHTTYVPDYLQRSKTGIFFPQQHFKFVWSNHSHDIIQQKVRKEWNKSIPEFLPVNFSIIKPGQVFKPLGTDKFPIQLSELMKYGESIFYRLHGAYFFGNPSPHASNSELLLRKTTGIAKTDTRLLINNPALTGTQLPNSPITQ